MKFKSNIEAQAKVFIGDLGSANATRFPNALSVTSIVPSGVQHNESLYIGLMAEALSVGTTWASGIYGAGYTNAGGSGRGTGVTGEGHVGTAADTGVAVGVRGYAKDIHTGNYNIGLYGDAENGDPGLTYEGNVSLFLANGNIVTSSAAAKKWYLGGNLAFDGQGTSKIISATNGAKFDFGGTSSQLVGGDGSIISAGSGITISGGIISASGGGYVPYTGATSNVNLGSYSITATSLIKAGGTADQYLKADGSVSTAMNSRVEVNFIATSGQTTFTTPYEVGQVEVYYNGSKLYPDEFVATNGSTIVLVTPATLNAQISIVKFVSSFNTTSIRTETVFTTTGGQTTFSVNYAIGQVDVFYNGSKLSPAEFTATNGISVVLGFACAAGESIVIDSFVNQVSGALGTTNYLSKFTGTASLGNSLVYDDGTNVSIGNTSPLSGGSNAKWLTVNGSSYGGGFISSVNGINKGTLYYDQASLTFSMYAPTGVGATIHTDGSERMRIFSSGNVFIGPSPSDAGYKLDINGTGRFIGSVRIGNVDFGTNQVLSLAPGVFGIDAPGVANGRFIVNGSGNVGIGTNGPQTLAHLYTSTARAIPALGSAGGHFMIQTGGVIATVMGVNANGNFYLQPQHINAGGSTVYNTLLNPSGGNVAVGINYSPTAKFHVEGQDIYLTGNTDNRIRFSNYAFTGNSMGAAIGYIYRVANTQESGSLAFYTNKNSVGPASMAESMRISSNGDVLVGWQGGTYNDPVYNNVVGISLRSPNNSTAICVNNSAVVGYFGRNGTTGALINFNYNGATTVGSISISSSSTSYNTSSDYRLKEDLKPIENALERLSELKPVNFAWKSSGERVDGFIAHELAEVIPTAVSGEKDATEEVEITPEVLDEEGNIIEEAVFETRDVYQGIDQSKIVPLLVAAIQELTARLETLENK